MKFFLFLVLIGALFGALFFYWVTKWLLKRKLKRRFNRASDGEDEAISLLKSLGYHLLETQKSSWLSMWIDQEEHTYLVRPDAYVQKEGRLYLVEIKTGPQATNPKLAATRRQLLEYYHGFREVEGILLINADLQQVVHVSFDPPKKVKESFARELQDV